MINNKYQQLGSAIPDICTSMMKLNSHSIKIYPSILMLLLVSLTLINKAFFMHSHVNSLGQVVVHAHPFQDKDSDEDSSSDHSHSDFVLSAWLAFDTYEGSISFEGSDNQPSELNDYIIPTQFGVHSIILTYTKGRAPPKVV